MSITFYPYRRTEDGFSIAAPRGADLPNFANGNARDMLEELGFEPESMWDAELVALDLFEQACVLALAGFNGAPTQPIGPRITRGDGPTVIECGRPLGYMNRRINDLLVMVRQGRKDGATHVGWG